MTRGRIAWTLVGLDIAAYLVSSLHPSDGGVGAVILYLVGIASIAGVGALADWPGFVTMSERTTERMAA